MSQCPGALWELQCLTSPVGELRLGGVDGVNSVDVSPRHCVAAGRQATGSRWEGETQLICFWSKINNKTNQSELTTWRHWRLWPDTDPSSPPARRYSWETPPAGQTHLSDSSAAFIQQVKHSHLHTSLLIIDINMGFASPDRFELNNDFTLFPLNHGSLQRKHTWWLGTFMIRKRSLLGCWVVTVRAVLIRINDSVVSADQYWFFSFLNLRLIRKLWFLNSYCH